MQYIILGLREEKYIGKKVSGHNCDFKYTDEERVRHVILMLDYNTKQRYELTLWNEDGECGSGWCTASYGRSELKEVELFACKTHTIEPFLANFNPNASDFRIENESGRLFVSVSEYGGCHYYPSGYVEVKTEEFKLGGTLYEAVAVRRFQKRPVLVFHGDSNACKSHLAALSGKSVFETDAHDTLPSQISEDIIVIGNRHGYDIDDVRWNIFNLDEAQVIEVHFKHSDM